MRRPLALRFALPFGVRCALSYGVLALALLPAVGRAQPVLYGVLGQPYAAESVALGGGGTFLPSTDPLAALRSPAHFAEAGREPGVYTAGYVGDDGGGYGMAALAVTAGREARLLGGRVALGAGVSYANLGWGEQTRVWSQEEVGTVNAIDDALMVGVGAGFSGPVRVDAGVAFRYDTRRSSAFVNGAEETTSVGGPSFDLGITASLPLLRPRLTEARSGPFLDLSLGYVQRHIGPDRAWDERSPDAAPDILPRTATLGYAVRHGIAARYPLGDLRTVEFAVAVEADALLNLIGLDPDANGPYPAHENERALLVGDLRPVHVLFGGIGENGYTVSGRRGLRVTVCEALWIAAGQSTGPYAGSGTTAGLGVSMREAIYALGVLRNDAGLVARGRRPFDLRYALAAQFGHEWLGPNFAHTLTLAWRRF
ncbi:MAG TPA: hypothetical protein VK610_07010 [Rhodothermales bacterium]|nr:hypothetical protein [Rhodothermales bacterium]